MFLEEITTELGIKIYQALKDLKEICPLCWLRRIDPHHDADSCTGGEDGRFGDKGEPEFLNFCSDILFHADDTTCCGGLIL